MRASGFVYFSAMELLGASAPPPLEDFDVFMRSLQSCPTNLLALDRYLGSILLLPKKGVDFNQVRELSTPFIKRSFAVGDYLKKGSKKKKRR